MRRIQWSVVILAAGILSIAAAQAPDAVRVTPLARDGQVYVSFELAGGLTDEIRDTIASGLQTSFAYEFELRRGVSLWVDRTIATTSVVASVRYDNLTRRHQLSRTIDGRVDEAIVTEDPTEVGRWMTSFIRLPLFRTTELEPNSEYYVRVRLQARPRSTWSLLPWDRAGAWGLARFTFIP